LYFREESIVNIYKKLGAGKADWGHAPVPSVYQDGSACDMTKAWALNKLGYVDTDTYTFNSWCEAGDKSNLTPFRVSDSRYNASYCLSPAGEPGQFDISVGRYGNKEIYVRGVYWANEMLDVLDRARILAQKVFDNLSVTKTENPHFDDRYEWSEDLKSWMYQGKAEKLSLIHI
jgi:hypothetical protein